MDALITKLLDKKVQELIHRTEPSDVDRLLLNPPEIIAGIQREVADQIIARHKALQKLPKLANTFFRLFPPPLSIEQCSTPLTASYKARLISGKKLVDLTGGAGIDTYFLSKKYQETTHVESNHFISQVFEVNKPDNINSFTGTAEQYLRSNQEPVDVFIDPARRDHQARKVAGFEDGSPNLLELWPRLIAMNSKILVKAAPLIDLKAAVSQLSQISSIHILAMKNEVKEVLFLREPGNYPVEPVIHCVELSWDYPEFTFTWTGESTSSAPSTELSKYIYDPGATILKAGAFKLIASRYNLRKLGQNTHLYTSDERLESFPGRSFEVIASDLSRKTVGKLLSSGKANVIVKNYPANAQELKKKLKIKEGGEDFLFAFRDFKGTPKLALARRA